MNCTQYFHDTIVVNTDSEEALSIAEEFGVEHHRREEYFASSECNNSELFQNLAENTDSDFIMYSPCTAPLILKETYYDFQNNFWPSLSIKLATLFDN